MTMESVEKMGACAYSQMMIVSDKMDLTNATLGELKAELNKRDQNINLYYESLKLLKFIINWMSTSDRIILVKVIRNPVILEKFVAMLEEQISKDAKDFVFP